MVNRKRCSAVAGASRLVFHKTGSYIRELGMEAFDVRPEIENAMAVVGRVPGASAPEADPAMHDADRMGRIHERSEILGRHRSHSGEDAERLNSTARIFSQNLGNPLLPFAEWRVQ